MKLSVLMAAFNEEEWIERSILRVLAQTVAGVTDMELIVVDDGSSDRTRSIIEKMAGAHPLQIVPVFHEKNKGKGAALKSAIKKMTGDLCIIQDADLEYDPGDYPLILEPILSGRADCVYGSRFVGTQSRRVLFFWHSVGNKFLTLLSNAFTNINLTDMETCYKAFRVEVLKNIPIDSDRFGFEPEITAKIAKGNYHVFEVGVSYNGRTYADGKKINWKDGLQAVFIILKYGIFYAAKKKRESPSGEPGLPAVTRGFGLLERFLARQRCRMADRLIPDHHRQGKVLDIGCGTYPLFLTRTQFREKVGLDKIGQGKSGAVPGMTLVNFDFAQEESLPFRDKEFDVVSMLAVAEHLEPQKLKVCFQEARRILKDDGLLVLTTPAFWTGPILRMLSYCGFVSREEIEEHKCLYRPVQLRAILQAAGFSSKHIRHGYFEAFMNMWFQACPLSPRFSPK